VRRFGTWFLLEPGELEPYLASRVGEELLNQRVFAGVGNIYADEALWWARIHPHRPAASLEPAELRSLLCGVRMSLRHGIARQGATLRNYRGADGRSGSMQREFRVYGRASEPCTRCEAPIEKTRAGCRGTWYCPGCQL